MFELFDNKFIFLSFFALLLLALVSYLLIQCFFYIRDRIRMRALMSLEERVTSASCRKNQITEISCLPQAEVYVVDSSVLLNESFDFQVFKGVSLCIPEVVLRELDGLKKSGDEVLAKRSRAASRLIHQYLHQSESDNSSISVSIISDYKPLSMLNSLADNKIIGAALFLKEKSQRTICLLTNDRNMQIAALSHSIQTSTYQNEVALMCRPANKSMIPDDLLPISPSTSWNGQKVAQFIGMVCGDHVCTPDSDDALEVARIHVMQKISDAAKKIGADAILDFRLTYGAFEMQGSKWQYLAITGYGMAVKFEASNA